MSIHPQILLLVGALLMACGCENVVVEDSALAAAGAEADDVQDGARALTASSLRFVSVSDGGRYPDPVLLQVEAPTSTAYVVYSTADAVLGVASERSSAWAFTARLGSPGERRVVVRAFDGNDRQLGEMSARLTIAGAADAAEASLRFISPATAGGHYVNGIWFKTTATGRVERVRYSADGFTLGESTRTDFELFYTFSRVGERRVLAEGLDAAGAVVARAERAIVVVDPNAPPSTRAGKAQSLLIDHEAGSVVFWEQQFGGRVDGADAWSNIRDTARGGAARRSVHGSAPGGTVQLSSALLDGMLALEQRGFRFFVTSVAGGAHSSGSLHYSGRAFDIDEINGVRILGDTALARGFMSACRELGAIEVFGPSNDPRGHFDHIHCAW
jgi:hypothetical protein